MMNEQKTFPMCIAEMVERRNGSGKRNGAIALCRAILVAALCALPMGAAPPSLLASPLDAPPPTLIAISPTEAHNWQPTTVTITGEGFFAITGTGSLLPTAYLGNVPLPNVTFISSTTLTATVPADLPGGTYTLTVTNPDSQSASLANAFTVLLSGDGSLSVWQTTSSMTMPRTGFTAVSAGSYIYALGGWPGSVERTAINPDGSLGPWQATTSMTGEWNDFAAVAASGYIYALGGTGGDYKNVTRAAINADGSLGPWQAVTSMTTERRCPAAVAVGGYLYAIGGFPKAFPVSLNSVERAEINSDGSLGPWQAVTPMTEGRSTHAAVVVGNYIYVMGGDGMSSVERATVNPDGSLGPWEAVTSMTTPRCDFAAVTARGYVYALGGRGGWVSTAPRYDSVERARVNADGSLGSWQAVISMTTPRRFFAAVAARGYVYAIGGMDELNTLLSSVERAVISPLSLTSLSPSAVPADCSTITTITGSNFLPTPSVRLGETATLDVSFVSTSTLTATVPAGLASGWYTATLTNPDGQVAFLADVLRVDDTVPTAGGLTINGGALNSTSISVTLTVSATDSTDGVAEMSFSNDGSTWSDWQPYSVSASWSLLIGDGLKTVYGRFRDTASNVSPVVSDTINLDTTAPPEYGLSINDGALFTNKMTVTLTIGAQPGTAQMQVSNEGNFADAEWEPYASRKSWQVTQYLNYVIPRLVYVRYKDVSGNVSSTYLDDIILDVNAPTGSVEATSGVSGSSSHATGTRAAAMHPLSISATGDHPYAIYLPLVLSGFCTLPTGPANITLSLEATDDLSGVADMMISHLPDCKCGTWEPYATTKAWYVPEETTTIYVKFRDSAGNVSEVATDTITVPLQ